MIYSLEAIKYHPWSKVTGQYDRTYVGLSPWISRTGLVTTGIPAKKLRELEEKLGYRTGTLEPHGAGELSFLSTYQIKLMSGKLRIDTSTPEGELQYEFLIHHPHVAKDLQSVTPKHSFVLKNEDAEAKVKNVKNQQKIKAIDAYKKMTIEEMKRALRIMGRKSDSMSNDLVQSTLYTIIDETPQEFMTKWVENDLRDYEFAIESAVSAGVIIKNRSNYKYGTDSLALSRK
ncbi:hypothetical protein AGMMS50239_41420 [Bacteroidia bacterium]|nr:hypothetical protein AGMMS50239_41420 [Bacteroidia bacterium]